ncbi:MAG: hypothetical protein Q9227_007397 [Pyrenula ochraceoflavens]
MKKAEAKGLPPGAKLRLYAVPVTNSPVRAVGVCEPLVDTVELKALVTDPCPVFTIDLNTIKSTESSFTVPYSLKVQRNDFIHALAPRTLKLPNLHVLRSGDVSSGIVPNEKLKCDRYGRVVHALREQLQDARFMMVLRVDPDDKLIMKDPDDCKVKIASLTTWIVPRLPLTSGQPRRICKHGESARQTEGCTRKAPLSDTGKFKRCAGDWT